VQRLATRALAFEAPSSPPAGIAPFVDTTSAFYAQEQANTAAVNLLVQVSGVVAACQAAALVEYPSAQAAFSMRSCLSDALDTVTLLIDDETLYAAITDLRAAVLLFLTETAAQLPNVQTYTPARTLPCLVVAHQVFGDATMEGQILAANHVANPALVQGGAPLEVLSDAA
jgi:prophage DNA circulation protein